MTIVDLKKYCCGCCSLTPSTKSLGGVIIYEKKMILHHNFGYLLYARNVDTVVSGFWCDIVDIASTLFTVSLSQLMS
jgi:hypothetical protein